MTEKFPAAALHIGAAVSPFAPHEGLLKALAIAGRERIMAVTESLKGFDGKSIDEVLGVLSAAWCTAKPATPAIVHLKMLGADAVVTALAANLFARTDDGFNLAAINALSPGVRAMAGLPSSEEITPAPAPAPAPVEPMKVEVVAMPRRETASKVERNQAGEIVATSQIEHDA